MDTKPFWNDQPIINKEQDRFDFTDYAKALSKVVLSGDTPLTIGIFGPWGSGKTSLMRLIIQELMGQRTEQHRRAHVIWFNAWQYERDQGAMWRSLLLCVLEGLKALELSPQDAQLISDWESRLYTNVQRTERGSIKVDWSQLGKGALNLGLSLVPSPATMIDLLKIVNEKSSKIEELIKSISREQIEVYRRQLKLLEEFQQGFAQLIKEHIWSCNGILVIFVDDLDRCLPDRALEVLETIKIFLDVPGCAFFLAVDHERIESLVQKRYGEQQTGVGQSYMEKLVQLPFQLPPLEEEQMAGFVADAAPHLSPDVRRIFSYGLASNPRMIKRVLNILHLLQDLAERRVARGTMKAVDPALLAKVVVIQGGHQELYHDLQEYPNLIQELELHARGMEDEPLIPLIPGMKSATPLMEKYVNNRALMRMLRIGTSFTSLTPLQISAYIHLTLPTGQDQAAETDPQQRIWNDLLSGDPTRIYAAVETVMQQAMQKDYTKALGRLVAGKRLAPLNHRLSAAWALGYLGDPRDFDEVVEIKGGEFPYGPERLSYYVLSYCIGRYPVTNIQYARFLAANPDARPPYVDEDWAHPYNWDVKQRTYPPGRANMPVVLVTWEEAQAYCTWVGGRLAREQEWERAARGEDGRIYPWGDMFIPEHANTRELGIGSPTPVGLFTEGQSPYSLLDMAGNIWEWMENDYNAQTKVIRGGAWNFFKDSARTFARERSRPENRSHSIGFRVAFDTVNPHS